MSVTLQLKVTCYEKLANEGSHIGRRFKILHQKRDEPKQPPSSLFKRGKGTTSNMNTSTNWLSRFVGNIEGKSWKSKISSTLLDVQTLELISQSLQPSENPAKDPRGTPEHGTSIILRRRPWNFNVSSRIVEVVLHINPTCGVEAELGRQTATETVLD